MLSIDLESVQKRIQDHTAPFTKIIRCNMGNPFGVGQKQITFVRQLIAACLHPDLIHQKVFPQDVNDRAERILNSCAGKNSGSYQRTEGIEVICKDVADYITRHDGYECDYKSVILTNGATEAILDILRPIIRSKTDAVLTPKPGFPMYGASISYYNGTEIMYDLDEEDDWGFSRKNLDKALQTCKQKGLIPRAIFLTNPSNPTGSVQTRKQIEELITFAHENSILVIADQVYQHNVYDEGLPFISCRKVLMDMNKEGKCLGLELISVNSVSKSCYGECGRRGGYFQYMNISEEVISRLTDIISMGQTNTDGMIAMDVAVNPPKPGEPSYEQWHTEYHTIFENLKEKARIVALEMDSWENLKCNTPTGAMYVFPSILIPQKAIEEAKKLGKEPDDLYCHDLLNEVGVVVLPGHMFGQAESTYHLRMTILPEKAEIADLLQRWKVFHQTWMKKYM